MSIENRDPVYIDPDGKEFFEGSFEYPYNFRNIASDPGAGDAEMIRADRDITDHNPQQGKGYSLDDDHEIAA